MLRARRDLDRMAQEAAAELSSVRLRARQAQHSVAAAETETAAARDALRAARDPLVALGAPALAERADLAAAWTELVSWANGQARIRGAQLATARRESEGLAQQLNAAQARFTEAGAALSRLQAGATAAARQEQNAATKLSELDKRISQLADQLRGVPGEDVDSGHSSRCGTAWKQRRQRLTGGWLAARAEREQAEHALDDLERAGASAREQQLSATRDPLVVLGAPRLDPASLLTAWTALAD